MPAGPSGEPSPATIKASSWSMLARSGGGPQANEHGCHEGLGVLAETQEEASVLSSDPALTPFDQPVNK